MKNVWLNIFQFFSLGILLAGCAAYYPKPLPTTPNFLHILSVGQKGYTMDQVATLAVLNNPDLKLARDDVSITHAQAFAAGLLPDPQFNLGMDFPTSNQPGTFTALSYGLSYDTTALLTRGLTKKSADAQAEKVNLTLLWQEWQVVSQARLLYIKTIEQKRLLRILEENYSLQAVRYQQIQQALQEGDTTLDIVDADLTALNNADTQMTALKRQINQTHHDLNNLLGLSFDVNLPLATQINIPILDQKKMMVSLRNLLNHRPDLLALKAGYQSEDVRYRQAVWAQFPDIILGLTRARDTSDVKTMGFNIGLNLPVFNRNQGNIAIEKATRQRLYDEFQYRINSADSEVRSLLADQLLLEKALIITQQELMALSKAANHAKIAYHNGYIDEVTYRTFQIDFLNKQADKINLEQNILSQRVALQILLGRQLP